MMTHIYIHLNVIVKNVRNDLLRIFKVNEEDDEYVPYSPPSSSSAAAEALAELLLKMTTVMLNVAQR